MKKMRIPLIYALLVLYTIGPLILAIGAGKIAEANGCTLNEGSVHPCIIGGKDWGHTLYSMGVMGWFCLITVPTGAVGLLIYTIGLIGTVLYHKRNAPQNP